MPVNYAPHTRVVFGGTITDSDLEGGATVEIWSCTYQCLYTPTRPMLPSDGLAHLQQITGFFTSNAVGISPTVELNFVKVNRVGPDGKYVDPITVEVFPLVPPRGAGPANVIMPTEVAHKMTWDDGSRSPRGRGGFYLPRPANVVQKDGRYNVGVATNLAAALADFVGDINNLLDVTMGVASSVDASFRPITRVRVGRVPDVIRKRRNDLAEDYAVALVA